MCVCLQEATLGSQRHTDLLDSLAGACRPRRLASTESDRKVSKYDASIVILRLFVNISPFIDAPDTESANFTTEMNYKSSVSRYLRVFIFHIETVFES